MDRSEVRAIVERSIEPLMERLGIAHWQVIVSYDLRAEAGEAFGARCEAMCTRLVDYNKAWVEFAPDEFDDEAGVIKALRHELFHIVLAPYDLLASAVDRLDLPPATHGVLDCLKVHVTEKAVINLERMFAQLTDA